MTPGHAPASGPRVFIFHFSLSAGPALPPTAQVICSSRAPDPSGTPTVSGTANQWPFLYHDMEQEGVDEFPHYYYTGNGQFYNTQMVRSLSEVGETGTSGPGGGPAGNAIAPPSGGGNGSFGHWYVNNVLNPSSTGNQLGNLPDIGFSSEAGSFVIPLGTIAQIIEEWVSFFEWLFGGSQPEIPRQLLHNRHPLYPIILGVPDRVIPDEAPAGNPPICGDPSLCPDPPLQSQPNNDKQAMCFEQFEACEKPLFANPECPKRVLEYGLGLAAGCFPISAASGPAFPETLAGCESATATAVAGGLAVCGCITLARSANCVAQFINCSGA